MNSSYHFSSRFFLVSLAVMPLLGAPVSDLASRADVIVKGSASAFSETGDKLAFTIKVDRVLKANQQIGSLRIEHQLRFPGPVAGLEDVTAPYGIWFLKQKGPQEWDVLQLRSPNTSSLSDLYLPVRQSGSLAPEFSTSLLPATIPLADELASEVVNSLLDGSIPLRDSLAVLKDMDSPGIRSSLTALSHSPNSNARTIGVAGLLERNDKGALPELKAVLSVVPPGPARDILLAALRNSFRSSSATDALLLGQLATDPSSPSDFRGSAIRALVAIHSKKTSPFLATLLTSSDPDERMSGVIGLSAFANGCPIQTPENVASMDYLQFKISSPYRTPDTMANFAFRRGPSDQEEELTSFWVSWWSRHASLVLRN